jgi:hypothetical protein
MKNQNIWEMIVGVVVLCLGIAAWVFSAEFPTQQNPIVGPALFPRALGLILGISALYMLGSNLLLWFKTKRLEPEEQVLAKLGRLGLVIVVLAFVPLVFAQIGLLWTAALYTVCACLVLGAKPLEALMGGGVMLGFVYLVFIQILKVQA